MSHPPPRAAMSGMSSRDEEIIRVMQTMESRKFYCFVTPDRADITHDRVHILVKTLMFIVLSFVCWLQGRSQIITRECEQDIVPEISANNLYASCQHWAPLLAARLVIFYEEENIDVLYIIISGIISLSLNESLFDLYHLIIIREAERSSIWSLIGWWWGEINNTYFLFAVASSHGDVC